MKAHHLLAVWLIMAFGIGAHAWGADQSTKHSENLDLKKDHLSLTLRTRAGYEAVVGQPIDLVFVLRNQGTNDFVFSPPSCPLGISHVVTLDVTEPDGITLRNAVQIMVGGPGFFTNSWTNIVRPRQEIELPCSLAKAEKKVVWSPRQTGSHKIVGHYELPVPSSRPPTPIGEQSDYITLSSGLLALDVIQPDGNSVGR